jgi:hypothetical protein
MTCAPDETFEEDILERRAGPRDDDDAVSSGGMTTAVALS